MPGFRAKKLCPTGIFLPNRRRVYSEFSDRVFAILGRYSPEVHPISIDEAVVDLTGTEKIFGPPLKTAEALVKSIRTELGLPASAGLSSSRVVAKIAATLAKPSGLIFVPAGAEASFLSPLEVNVVPGVGPKTHKRLLQRGIKTIGDLLAEDDLALRYLDLSETDHTARHHDHSVGNETTLEEPLKDIQAMREVLWNLVEEVGGRLRREKLYARCLTVKIRYTDFETNTRSRTLATPTCFDREIFEVVGDLLAQNLRRGRAVRLLGVSASALQSSGWQEPLFGNQKRRSLERLYKGVDQLREKYGPSSIGSATAKNRAG